MKGRTGSGTFFFFFSLLFDWHREDWQKKIMFRLTKSSGLFSVLCLERAGFSWDFKKYMPVGISEMQMRFLQHTVSDILEAK